MWMGHFVFQKVLQKYIYIARRLNTPKTQISYLIRLKQFVSKTPLEEKHREEKLQPDDEMVIPRDDLYTISWKVANNAASGEVNYYVTKENESSSANDSQRSSERRNENEGARVK